MSRSRWILAAAATAVIAATSPARAGTCDQPAPEWLFCEDFEKGSLGWDAWYAQSPFVECNGCTSGAGENPARIMLDDNPEHAYRGNFSLVMPAEASANYRGASLTFRSCEGAKKQSCTLIGHDQLYYRAWVRLAPDHQKVHHFMSIGGTRPGGYWDSEGNAGCRPNGYRAAGTTLDFNQSHELFFYTYFPEMKCDNLTVGGGYCANMQPALCDQCAAKDMPCTHGEECCWGNHFSPTPKPVLPVGAWVCLEMMMKLNTPGQDDGEMAFWVDGELGHLQTGMSWRDIPELQLNKIWVQHYLADGDATQSNRIWWDDIVASTARIGCGEVPPAADAGVEQDAAAGDSGAQDAHAPDSSAADGASDLEQQGALSNSSGCGCRLSRTGHSLGWATALGVALLSLRRRSRRT